MIERKSSKQNDFKKNKSFFIYLILPNLLVISIGFIAYFYSKGIEVLNPSYYFGILILLIIILFKFLASRLIKFYSKKVISIKIFDSHLSIKYKKGFTENTIELQMITTEIELDELLNSKGFFIGLEINLMDRNQDSIYNLTNKDWSYKDFELIYTEFKKRKNEVIPENEKSAFQQLLIMNCSINAEIK